MSYIYTIMGFFVFTEAKDGIGVLKHLQSGLLNAPLRARNMNSPCKCGIYLEGQLYRDGTARIDEQPIFIKEINAPVYPCGVQGSKLCVRKCIEMLIDYMPKLGPLVCSSIDRNCKREKAHLFIRNCEDRWENTGYIAGKEFCCTEGIEVKCPSRLFDTDDDSEISEFDSIGKYLPEIIKTFAGHARNIAMQIFSA